LLVLEAEAAKEGLGSWHGRVAGGTGRAKLLTWGKHIFVFNLRIFNPNQLQSLFRLLQDSIFGISVPEIK